MNDACREFEVLLSGLLDGELSAEDQSRLQEHIAGCARCRKEYESLRRLVVGTTAALAVPPPPPERWEHFLDDVYNRLERRVGWTFFLAGLGLLGVTAVILFLTLPWASALVKLLLAVPAVGLAILFVSVLRERLAALKHDRYSREVQR